MSEAAAEGFSGGCFCGRVRFEVSGAPGWLAYCHCESCRRQTASPATAFIGIKRGQLRYTGTAPACFHSSPGVTRSFCPDCGTPIAFETERRPDDVDLYLCAADEPARFQPTFHVHLADRLPWFEIHDDLPRFERSGDDSGAG